MDKLELTTVDLAGKLLDFKKFYSCHRTYAGLEGRVPEPGVTGNDILQVDVEELLKRPVGRPSKKPLVE